MTDTDGRLEMTNHSRGLLDSLMNRTFDTPFMRGMVMVILRICCDCRTRLLHGLEQDTVAEGAMNKILNRFYLEISRIFFSPLTLFYHVPVLSRPIKESE